MTLKSEGKSYGNVPSVWASLGGALGSGMLGGYQQQQALQQGLQQDSKRSALNAFVQAVNNGQLQLDPDSINNLLPDGVKVTQGNTGPDPYQQAQIDKINWGIGPEAEERDIRNSIVTNEDAIYEAMSEAYKRNKRGENITPAQVLEEMAYNSVIANRNVSARMASEAKQAMGYVDDLGKLKDYDNAKTEQEKKGIIAEAIWNKNKNLSDDELRDIVNNIYPVFEQQRKKNPFKRTK